MKFIFDRAVKDVEDGFHYTFSQGFTGGAPWLMQGIKFDTPDDWFDYARKVGRALGITDCECAVEPSNSGARNFIFSFKNIQDYMAFQIALGGNRPFEHTRAFSSPTNQRSVEFTHQLEHFLEANEISAKILRLSYNRIKVITNNQLDDFIIAQAVLKGELASNLPTANDLDSPKP